MAVELRLEVGEEDSRPGAVVAAEGLRLAVAAGAIAIAVAFPFHAVVVVLDGGPAVIVESWCAPILDVSQPCCLVAWLVDCEILARLVARPVIAADLPHRRRHLRHHSPWSWTFSWWVAGRRRAVLSQPYSHCCWHPCCCC